MLSRVLSSDQAVSPLLAWQPRPTPTAPSNAPARREDAGDSQAERERLNSAIEQKIRQAYHSGFQEGEAAAAKKGEEQVRETVERLAAAMNDVSAMHDETLRRAEGDTVRLAIEIARRILHRELSVDTPSLEALVRAALEKLRSQEVFRVRVHPDLESVVRNCLQQSGRNGGIEVISDPSRPRGGAVFELSRGSLDASVETQLREIERGLADQLGERA